MSKTLNVPSAAAVAGAAPCYAPDRSIEAPPFDELWSDGRSVENPPLSCWLFGHKRIREFSPGLQWTWERCIKCWVRFDVQKVHNSKISDRTVAESKA